MNGLSGSTEISKTVLQWERMVERVEGEKGERGKREAGGTEKMVGKSG